MIKNPARIWKFSECTKGFRRETDEGEILILTSGGYDPIHPGHVSYLLESKDKGYELKFGHNFSSRSLTHVAVVNGDWFLSQKKGKPFMPLEDRCKIVSGIIGVDIVLGLDVENDMTVNQALELVKPDYFMKGGDRTGIENIPEWETCQKLGIKVVTEMGANKDWSSSNYLSKWNQDNP